MRLWHITLISFKNKAQQSIKDEAYRRLLALCENCGGREAGILFWGVGKNIDLRKGIHLVVISIFKNKKALEKYKQHLKHKELTDLLSQVADWQDGDIWVQGSL